MRTTKIAGKSFDEWADLAKSDGENFERQRLAAIEAYIESVPPEHRERLQRLQWRIDQERRLARTPMAACLKLSRMMWKNVLGPGGLRERFEELGCVLQNEPVGDPSSKSEVGIPPAQVLAFARD